MNYFDEAVRTMREQGKTLTREQVLEAYRKNCDDSMRFMPHDGICWSCNGDLIEQYGAEHIAAGYNPTGCRQCHRSFVD
jgi:hypothetical protein